MKLSYIVLKIILYLYLRISWFIKKDVGQSHTMSNDPEKRHFER
jgi:hypothetical protein